MPVEKMPLWASRLDTDEWEFVKNFLLSSGSLKEIAKIYGLTYPTIRLRLDRLIDKVKTEEELDSYSSLIKRLALEDKIDLDTAKLLLDKYLEQTG